jgi:hypothetical protein
MSTAKEAIEAFEQQLCDLVNRTSMDALVGIPDYVLAKHLAQSLTVLAVTAQLANRHEEPRILVPH